MGWDLFGFERRHRQDVRAEPFPTAWGAVVDAAVPHAALLDAEERRELEQTMLVFLDRVGFEGAGGFLIDDAVRVTIAAQACLLLIGQGDQPVYPLLKSVVVYPQSWTPTRAELRPDGTVGVPGGRRLGESWRTGTMVLSWDDVRRGAADPGDGHNVVFHEFAHQLDQQEPHSAGAPVLPRRLMYAAWARVLGEAYRALIDDLEHDRSTLLDAYGATNAAEFFAVSSEFFFERPVALRRRHPALYEQLRLFYQQDPAARLERVRAAKK